MMPRPEEIPDTHSDSELERERLAAIADAAAAYHEKMAKASGVKQVRIVPEPQLSELKAKHWRIIADTIRKA